MINRQWEVDPMRGNKGGSNGWMHSKSRVGQHSSQLSLHSRLAGLLWKCSEPLVQMRFNLFMLSLLFCTEFSRSLLPRPRRLLLLVNPFSGRGQAMQWCQTHILPMIREANISYNLIQTGNTPRAKYNKYKGNTCTENIHMQQVLTSLICLRASEPCQRAHQRDIAPRVGWHHHYFWRRPAAWGV